MTETEADILDELYFVTSFTALSSELKLESGILCAQLLALVAQGYVKCFFPDPKTEVDYNSESFAQNYQNYFFLATKAGLLAHNSR